MSVCLPICWVLWTDAMRASREVASVETAIDTVIDDEPKELVFEPVDIPASAVESVKVEIDEGESVPDPILKLLVDEQIARFREESEQLTARKEADLREMAQRLHSISNEENVAAIATKIGAALGFQPQQVIAPSPTEELVFDDSSAQIRDVRLEVGEDGETIYIATLVDPQGLSKEIQLDQSEGQELHRLFKLMNEFPLLRQVYESVVVGIVDRILEAEAPAVLEPAKLVE